VDELVTLNEILLDFIEGGEVGIPFSFLEAPGLSFKLTRPPRFFRRLSYNSLVDIIHLKSSYKAEEQEIVNQLKASDPVPGSDRIFKGDLLIVKWGDLKQQPAETILARRYAWYAEHGSLPVDSSFNALGDKEFALWNAQPTRELSGYSSFNKKAIKAGVFDTPDEAVELLESLRRMLDAGETVEGYPVREITLVVPSRESAIELQPLANRYGISVIYAGNDNKLWNPFPPEYEPVSSGSPASNS
jgi:hypothetical protein